MTRVLTLGCETGDLSDIYSASNIAGWSASTEQVRTGAYSYRCFNSHWARFRSWSSVDTVYIGYAIYPESIIGTTTMKLLDDTTIQATLQFNANGYLVAYRGDGANLLATGTHAAITTGFQYIEVYYYCHDTSGRFQVKINGVTDIDFTGDTKPSTNATVNTLQLQSCGITYYDDVVVNTSSGTANNTWPGIVKLVPIRPNAAGDTTQFSRGGTDSGANWSQVEEVPINSGDYVYNTVVDQVDLYNCSTFTLPDGATVKNIVAVAQAQMDSGAGNLALGIKSGGSGTYGSDQALSIAWLNYEETFNVDPSTGIAWVQSGIDSVQVGIKAR